VEVEAESGITDVQVFVGEVEVERTDGAGAGPKQRLQAGFIPPWRGVGLDDSR
jgi:hypothetical protein